MTTTNTTWTPRLAPPTAPARGVVVASAVAAAVGTWLVAVPLLGIKLRVETGGQIQTVGIVPVVGVSLLAGLLGWALLALLQRWTTTARTTWTVIATAVLLLSLAGPLTGASTGRASAALVVMHLLVGAVLILGLRRSSSGRRAAGA